MSEISLIPLNEENKSTYLSLQVYDHQTAFVEPPEESLADMEKHAWHIDWSIQCIYADEHMVGYAMHGMNRYKEAWLDRFMIDRRYQGRGYGTKALTLLLSQMEAFYPDRKAILLSVEKHNDKVIKLYESFGFRMTHMMDGIYPVMIKSES